MSGVDGSATEIIRLFLSFMTENMAYFSLMLVVFIFRSSISDFFSRLTIFNFRTGESELEMAAENKQDQKPRDNAHSGVVENPTVNDRNSDTPLGEEHWYNEISAALEEGRMDDARVALNKYSHEEKDFKKLEDARGYYLYMLFSKGGDNSAIDELERLIENGESEESRFNFMTWLSFCYQDGREYDNEIFLWSKAFDKASSDEYRTKSIVKLSVAKLKAGKGIEARTELVNWLCTIGDAPNQSLIYAALSTVEDEMGNKKLAAYCKDKALQYEINNREELFNSAYSANDVGCEEISISNYTKLCNIDSKHSFALNNLGVIAQEAGLNVKAVENYGRSLLQENSLAMANQGYLLLEAGFVEEASSIAQRALLLTEPHKSVHTLIAAIDEKKEKQNEDWLKLCEDAFERQKTIREYVEQYYLGSFEGLDQKWETEQGEEVLLDVGSEEITAAWQENGYGFDNGTFEVKISGTIHGATFKGKYQRKVSNTGLRTVLTTAGEHDKECLGFLTKKANEINIISSTLEDGLFIRLKNGC